MKKIIIALVAFLLVQTAVCYYLVHKSERKIVYADAIKLFDGYKLKTDMEQASQGTLKKLKVSLDSATAFYKVPCKRRSPTVSNGKTAAVKQHLCRGQ